MKISNITDCTINSSKYGIHDNHHNKWLENLITNSFIYNMPMFSHLLPCYQKGFQFQRQRKCPHIKSTAKSL